MNQLRCLIIDDKPLAIDILADHAGKIPFLQLVGTTTNPIEGLQMVREQNIDLVFLDIQMPELTGLQFIKIAGKQCKIILTTAYAEYALDGYEHDVVDYLLKPIPFERFYRAAEKALHVIVPGSRAATPVVPQAEPSPEFLFIKTEHRIQKVDLKDIRFIEGLQNYIAITTSNGKILSLQTLKKLEEQLPDKEFVRVHKSFIVALRHISSIERGRINIGDQMLPVGDRYRDRFYRMVEKI
ncbi:LytTR family DNA-binding domain-containing protein [Mucilaginibacter sp. UR6-11]|uniref:LytR/AlgR family response regulator transcription factor n=1 Tax=Mucilaginibacter sp. UR6-11 TaxID=1435644 RepID=UPI001E54FC2C|nr:LytTR family transcriptional regulator DNA-binding domain-containing protein [Mucilaginibacter sp. UR6-11]MCC8426477.1 LytTR family transcriptional regulator DNA-binding domain-containing protein [Mucilaginibacter sp. UR6-11]